MFQAKLSDFPLWIRIVMSKSVIHCKGVCATLV